MLEEFRRKSDIKPHLSHPMDSKQAMFMLSAHREALAVRFSDARSKESVVNPAWIENTTVGSMGDMFAR